MPVSTVLKWFRPLFWLGWKRHFLSTKYIDFEHAYVWTCVNILLITSFWLKSGPFSRKSRIISQLKNFHLLITLCWSEGFQKLIFFCEKSSNYKHVYLQTLLERETVSLHNKMILGLLMPPFTTALAAPPTTPVWDSGVLCLAKG